MLVDLVLAFSKLLNVFLYGIKRNILMYNFSDVC